MQNRSRFTDIEKKFLVTTGKRKGGRINKEYGIHRYTVLYIKEQNSKDLL